MEASNSELSSSETQMETDTLSDTGKPEVQSTPPLSGPPGAELSS